MNHELLRRMPKVELHVHLEGSFDAERIAQLAREAGEVMPYDKESVLSPSNLDELLTRLDWWCGLVRTPEQVERQAYDLARRLSDDGVVYAEVIVNPTHWSALRRDVLLEAVSEGFARASAQGLCDAWLLVSLLRSQTSDEAIELVAELERRPPSRLVGLSIDGNEAAAGPTGERFASAFALAATIGLGRTAHAGESSGPEGVWSALDQLRVTRIDHGVRSIEDPHLIERLIDDSVTLDVCLTSNVRLLYGTIDLHPLRQLVERGVAVTINTDDPATLGVNLTSEMALAETVCSWGIDGAIGATERAIAASFASDAKATELRRMLDVFAAQVM